jgi:hypothetical protein
VLDSEQRMEGAGTQSRYCGSRARVNGAAEVAVIVSGPGIAGDSNRIVDSSHYHSEEDCSCHPRILREREGGDEEDLEEHAVQQRGQKY